MSEVCGLTFHRMMCLLLKKRIVVVEKNEKTRQQNQKNKVVVLSFPMTFFLSQKSIKNNLSILNSITLGEWFTSYTTLFKPHLYDQVI